MNVDEDDDHDDDVDVDGEVTLARIRIDTKQLLLLFTLKHQSADLLNII